MIVKALRLKNVQTNALKSFFHDGKLCAPLIRRKALAPWWQDSSFAVAFSRFRTVSLQQQEIQ